MAPANQMKSLRPVFYTVDFTAVAAGASQQQIVNITNGGEVIGLTGGAQSLGVGVDGRLVRVQIRRQTGDGLTASPVMLSALVGDGALPLAIKHTGGKFPVGINGTLEVTIFNDTAAVLTRAQVCFWTLTDLIADG